MWISQQLEKSEQDKVDLQRKLKSIQGGEAAAAQKVCPANTPATKHDLQIVVLRQHRLTGDVTGCHGSEHPESQAGECADGHRLVRHHKPTSEQPCRTPEAS